MIGGSLTFLTIIVKLLDRIDCPRWSAHATTASTVPVQLSLAGPVDASARIYLLDSNESLTMLELVAQTSEKFSAVSAS